MAAVNTSLLCQILSGGGEASFPLDGLIHYWKLDESEGSQRLDSIGSLNLSESGGPVPSVPGKKNSAVQSQSTFLISSAWILTFPFSVSVWVKYSSVPTDDWYAVEKRGALGATWQFIISDLDVPSFRGSIFGASSVDPISSGDYHLLVGTYDGNVFRLSVDGSSFFVSPPGETYDAGSGVLQFVDSTSEFLHFLDEIGIWNRVLSQSEVASLWNSGAGRFL